MPLSYCGCFRCTGVRRAVRIEGKQTVERGVLAACYTGVPRGWPNNPPVSAEGFGVRLVAVLWVRRIPTETGQPRIWCTLNTRAVLGHWIICSLVYLGSWYGSWMLAVLW